MTKIKYRGTHNSLIPFARQVCEIITPLGAEVSPGIISPSSSTRRRVKLTKKTGWIELAVKQGSTVQEIRVFGDVALLDVAKTLRNADVAISFG